MTASAAVATRHPPGGAPPVPVTQSRWWLVGLAASLVVYAVTAASYAFSVPVGRSADEFSHLNYARLIADHGALPGAGVLERQQPPLYYLLAGALLKIGVPEQGIRLASLVFGVVAVVAVAAIVRVVLPQRPWLAAGAACVVALLPGFQDLGGSISNDPLAIAVGALLLLVTMLVLVAGAPTNGLLISAGALAGVALVTKETDWALVAVLAAAVVWRWRAQLGARHLVMLLGPALVIAGWWFLRNLATFHRPLPPLSLAGEHQYLRHIGQLRGFASETVRDLFSPERFQGGLVPLPRSGDVLVAGLSVLLGFSMLTALLLAVRAWRGWPASARTQGLFLGGAFVLAVLVSMGNSITLDLQPQARYLLVAVAGPALAVAWPWARLGETHPRVRTAVVAAAAIAVIALSAIGIHAAATAPG